MPIDLVKPVLDAVSQAGANAQAADAQPGGRELSAAPQNDAIAAGEQQRLGPGDGEAARPARSDVAETRTKR